MAFAIVAYAKFSDVDRHGEVAFAFHACDVDAAFGSALLLMLLLYHDHVYLLCTHTSPPQLYLLIIILSP